MRFIKFYFIDEEADIRTDATYRESIVFNKLKYASKQIGKLDTPKGNRTVHQIKSDHIWDTLRLSRATVFNILTDFESKKIIKRISKYPLDKKYSIV